jgi:transcriptional regulator with XRE-family HTH domain
VFIPFHPDDEIHMTLAELRTAFSYLTQDELGARLGTSQGAVSAFEKRADVRLSKLQTYVQALKGELEITVKFRTGHRVRLKQFAAPPEANEVGSFTRGANDFASYEGFGARELSDE